jgi:hypothetical protein
MKTQNKNQEERFEKVVEWNPLMMTTSLTIPVILTGILLSYLSYFNPEETFAVSLSLTLTYLFLTLILICLNRKVYWRKIK